VTAALRGFLQLPAPERELPALAWKTAPTRNPARRSHILVVEDNHESAESLRLLLELFGYEVTVTHSGPAGVEAARHVHPDAVVCDIGLPGLDGYGVAGALRGDPGTAGARLIAVTGYGRDEDRRRALAAGFDRHLVKPVEPERLLEELGPAGLN
jgi:CheY-like chemotaxis protein